MASTRHFGVLTDTSGIASGIIVTSMSQQKVTDQAEARNGKGQVTDIATYSKRYNISLNGLWCGDSIDAGTIVAVGGQNILITDVTKSESNNDFQQGAINGVYADSAELWDLATVSGQVSENLI